MASLVYAGPKEEGLKAMKPILDLGPFLYQNTTTIPWNKLATSAQFGINDAICTRRQIIDVYGFNLKTFNAATMSSSLRKMADFYAAQPRARRSVIILESWPNQAAAAVPDGDTAYPWRDATTYGLFNFIWDTAGDPVETPAGVVARELRKDFAATSGYGKLTVYVNYAKGDEGLEAIYSAGKLPRLAGLKKKYDPTNAFKYFHPLPTSYP